MKRGMLILIVAAVASGCAAPGVRFTKTVCHRVLQGERLEAISRALWPFIVAEVAVLVVIAYWPGLTLLIPRLLGL